MDLQEVDFLKHFRPKPPGLLIKGKINDEVFGETFHGVFNDQEVTVKKIGALFRHFSSSGTGQPLDTAVETLKKELRTFRATTYPYISEAKGIFYDQDSGDPLLVLQGVREDLNTFLSTRKKKDFSVAEQLVLAMQVATALRFIHLSEPNERFHYLSDKSVFLSSKNVVKMVECQQALVKLRKPSITGAGCGLSAFLPPEVCSDHPVYTHSGDIYSLGVLLLEIATLKLPVANGDEKNGKAVAKGSRHKQTIALLHDDHPLKKVIQSCLEEDPSRRPDIVKVHSDMSLRVEGPNFMFRGDLVLQGQQKMHSSHLPPLPHPTAFASGVFVKGKVYVGGGRCSDTNLARLVFVYSLSDQSWSTLPPTPQIYSQLVLVGSRVTLVGGCHADTWSVTGDLVQWDPKKAQWTRELKPMRTKRVRPAAVVHKGFLVVAGGLGEDLTHPLDSVEVADTVKFDWVTVGRLQLPKPLSCVQLVERPDDLFLVGGIDAEKTPSACMWSVSSRDVIQAFESSGGKKSKSKHSSASAKEPTAASSMWSSKSDAPFLNATFCSGGVFPLCIGGTDGQKGLSPNILGYNLSASKWALAGDLPLPLCHASVITLSSTLLLVTGGCQHPKNVEESLMANSELIYL